MPRLVCNQLTRTKEKKNTTKPNKSYRTDKIKEIAIRRRKTTTTDKT
jgi:hypothetical protein